ncbi:MAG: hypothetical protein AAB909_03510 [Patescibacteria group bacterium]
MNKTYIPAILILVLVFVLHYFGIHYYLYIRFTGYDIMMHVLGGVGLGLALHWFFKTFFTNLSAKKHFWSLLIGIIILGLLWEVMEGYYDITIAPVGTLLHWVDTVKDIINDTIGMLVAYLFVKDK